MGAQGLHGGSHTLAEREGVARFVEAHLQGRQSSKEIELIDDAEMSEAQDLTFEVILSPRENRSETGATVFDELASV